MAFDDREGAGTVVLDFVQPVGIVKKLGMRTSGMGRGNGTALKVTVPSTVSVHAYPSEGLHRSFAFALIRSPRTTPENGVTHRDSSSITVVAQFN